MAANPHADPRPLDPGAEDPAAFNPHADHLQELLEGLNEPQREAVTHGEGPLLILAGAGSGKTRVLTHRLAYLIYTDRAQAGEILAITFTNKAASEMRNRVERLLGRSTRGMWLMTFHAACARILRAEAPRLGYTRQFTIYDQADARRLTKRCMDEVGVDPKRYTPAAIHTQISSAKNRLLDAETYGQQVGSHFEELVADVYRLYERDLLRMNAMDFDDLLLRVVNLLELFGEVRERYCASFRHILVDEYQDTNHAQYRLLQLLVGGGAAPARGEPVRVPGHRNLAVVGDDAQSIYGFRNADIRNILDFQSDFPDARVVKLEQNYRSTETILAAANAVIAHNRGGIAKRLWSELGTGEPVHVRALEDEHAEARFVVGEIERLVDEGASRTEIAVLYRTNAMSRVLEDTLVRREIAYQVIGGTKFYERAEIKDAIAYLSLLANPFDVVSFTRIVNSPRRGIGQTSLGRIVAHSATVGVSVWEAAAAPAEIAGLGTAAVKALRRFMGTMEELRERVEPGACVADLLEAVLSQTGYIDALEAERTIEAQGRVENLQQLVEVAHEFDATVDAGASADAAAGIAANTASPGDAPAGDPRDAADPALATVDAGVAADGPTTADGPAEADDDLDVAATRTAGPAAADDAAQGALDLFLQQVALIADADTRSDEEGLVTLMTLHNAKGLEYPTVFIVGCEDGVFPHSRALDEGSLEEERRLFYVGITRAMRALYVTHARRRALFGAQAYGLPSRFLAEIPAELTDAGEELRLGAAGGGGGLTGGAGAFGGGDGRHAGSAGGTDGWRAGSAGGGDGSSILGRDRARARTRARSASGNTSTSPAGAANGWDTAARASAERVAAGPSADSFRLGEDILHAAFGDGVVTGVEPGGVIVVRFARDGAERKLMAELAPVSRRG